MRVVLRASPVFAGLVASFVVVACVSSPTEGATVPAGRGIGQPDAGDGGTLSAGAACSALVAARAAARARLSCPSEPEADCSGSAAYVSIAGARPCDAYDAHSVDACVAAYGAYRTCTDFDVHPCVVTAVASSCHAPRDGGPVASGLDASDARASVFDAAAEAESGTRAVVDASAPDAGRASSADDAGPRDAAGD